PERGPSLRGRCRWLHRARGSLVEPDQRRLDEPRPLLRPRSRAPPLRPLLGLPRRPTLRSGNRRLLRLAAPRPGRGHRWAYRRPWNPRPGNEEVELLRDASYLLAGAPAPAGELHQLRLHPRLAPAALLRRLPASVRAQLPRLC